MGPSDSERCSVRGNFFCLFLFAIIGTSADVVNAQYLRHGTITHADGMATIVTNDPRPLRQAVEAMREEYGALIDYEEPAFSNSQDLLDATDPSWRAANPHASGVFGIAGKPFTSRITEPGTNPAGLSLALARVVDDYNKSGNPGRFAVLQEAGNRFSVVPAQRLNTSGDYVKTKPILDTTIQVRAGVWSADQLLSTISEALTASTGQSVVIGSFPMNLVAQTQVKISVSGDRSARSVLMSLSKAASSSLVWTVLWDPNDRAFFLNLNVATRNSLDDGGKPHVSVLKLD